MSSNFKQDLLRVTALSDLPIIILADDFNLGMAYAERLIPYNAERCIMEVFEINKDISRIDNTTIVVTNKETKRFLHPYLSNYTQLTVHNETGGKTYFNILNCETNNNIQKVSFKQDSYLKIIVANKDEDKEYKYTKGNNTDYIHHVIDSKNKLLGSMEVLEELIELKKNRVFSQYLTELQLKTVFVIKLNEIEDLSEHIVYKLCKFIKRAKVLKETGMLIAIEGDPSTQEFKWVVTESKTSIELLSQHY